MHPTRRSLLGTAAATVALAGCLDTDGGQSNGGTNGDDVGTDTPEPTGTPEDTDGGTDGSSPTVQVRSHPDLGEVLVGPDGLTLYMFDQDESGAGESACHDGCADNWPPLTVEGSPEAGDDVVAELTTFERQEGQMQVAAAGWPLYYFTPDGEPGDASGQGVSDVWWVLSPDGTPIRGEDEGTPTEAATETQTPTPTPDGGSDGGSDAGTY